MDTTIKYIPKVSILMPVYNAEDFLVEAIDSILNQTFQNFEFIILNDGSTDQSNNIISSYNDIRIIYKCYQINQGYICRLNEGIDLASGEYIARMDADDISMSDRIAKQVEFMDLHKEYGLLGTGAQVIESNEFWQPNIEDDKIRLNFFITNQFVHTSVLIRMSILHKYKLYYNKDYYPAEDYELWLRISNFCKIGNLNCLLVKYRKHNNQTSFIHNKKQIDQSNRLRISLLEKTLNIKLNENDNRCFVNFISNNNDFISDKIILLKLKKLCNNKSNKNYKFNKELYSYFNNRLKYNKRNYIYNILFIQTKNYNLKILFMSNHKNISFLKNLKFSDSIKYIFKCFIQYRNSK